MKRILVIIVIILLLIGGLFAEDLNLRFEHLTTDHGLSQSNVTCIAQDKKGFMWFGTFNGLNRYDGYHFKTYHYSEDVNQGLTHNFISDIVVDSKGNIWVATGDGLNRIDPIYDKIEKFRNELPDGQIETMLVDSNDRIWVGTRMGGLAIFESEQQFKVLKGLQSATISLLFEDNSKNIWVVHDNGALDIVNENSLEVTAILGARALTQQRISAIVQSINDEIWVATQGDGLYHLRYGNDELELIAHITSESSPVSINSDIILSLLIDRKGLLWIGSEDNGIDILNSATAEISHYTHDAYDPYSLGHNSVWTIFEDMAGNIWAGTYAHGINLLLDRNSLFEHYYHRPGDNNSLSHNMVNTFLEGASGELWIGTDGGGLNRFDRKSGKFTHYNSLNSGLKTDVVLRLHEAEDDKIWLGTWAEGLYLFDPIEETFKNYNEKNSGLASNRILDIEKDVRSGLWIATFWRGLTYFDPDKNVVKIYSAENSGLSDNNVRVVMQDRQGLVWIGTDVGLDCFDPESEIFINYSYNESDANSISKGFVLSILETENGKIWAGTSGGLNLLDRESGTFTRYTVEDGLPDNEIKCILDYGEGELWLSTNRGICSFSAEVGTCKLYDHADGLQGNEFNMLSGYKTSSGEILFGGNKGFNLFKPSAIQSNDYIPPVYITGMKLFNQDVHVGDADSILAKNITNTQKITLRYDQDVFSFDYTALNYLSSQDNRYAYKLEGFENDWNYVGALRTAGYTNMDPGHYTFKVKAANNDGVWNEEGASLKIEIKPPFWQTWWAYIIEALFVLGLAYLIFRFYASRQRMRNDLKLEQLELEKMYELDQMKTRFFSNISHEFNAPMTLILSPLEKLSASLTLDGKSKDSLGLVMRNVRRLRRMVDQLKDVQKLETGDLKLQLSTGNIISFIKEIVDTFKGYALDHGMELSFGCDSEREMVWFDTDKVDKIVYNLLSNAFKFTKNGGKVGVKLELLEPNEAMLPVRNIQISVSDTGIGIAQDKIELIMQRFYRVKNKGFVDAPGSGIGLSLVSELLKLYHGKIRVESEEGKGSTFIVNIPLDDKYLEEHQLVSEFIRNTDADEAKEIIMDVEREADEEEKLLPADMPMILIVEDDDEIRDYIQKSLLTEFRVKLAENGKVGLEKAIKYIPDLVLSDIKMPVMDGIELCNKLKESEKTSHIPVILLTAYSSKQSKIEGLKKGADAYIAKPFNIDMLNAQIVNLLQSRKQLRKKFSTDFLVGPQNADVKDVDERFLQRIVEVIEKNISDTGLNADTLGKKVGMSRTQLYRKVRGLTDQTVNEFIKQIRLKRAAQLLGEKRVTITEVAYAVGFNDLTYFARCFKKQYKKSPSEYISPAKR